MQAWSIGRGVALGLTLLALSASGVAQLATHNGVDPPKQAAADAGRRTRLYLKDGSFQVVMRYRVDGDLVRYVSAERGGQEEEIPLSLVDLPATKAWETKQAASRGEVPSAGAGKPPAIDPELLKEEEARRELAPEIAKDLHLPDESGATYVMDTFHGQPQLVPLVQSAGDLNRNTAHSLLKAAVNPLSSAHQIVTLKGESADVQLHVANPVLYLRVGDEPDIATGRGTMVVDTHGATSAPGVPQGGGSEKSTYVVVRLDVRRNARVVTSFIIRYLGGVQRQENVVEMKQELMPGGFWLKLTPAEPLDFGEYALMEVLSDKDVNIDVWDFGVHPTAAQNRDVILPEPKKPVVLGHRPVISAPTPLDAPPR